MGLRYKLAHVCQGWRNAMLGLASHLSLSPLRTNGTRDQCASMSPTVCWRHTGTFTSLPIYNRLSLDKYHDTAEDKLETIFDLEERAFKCLLLICRGSS